MALPLYLAMTRAEFTTCSPLPEHPAWMACHFSPYGTGLTNLPPSLPHGAMVIVNDRIPISGHDPEYILSQLRQINCACFLLDFQRPAEQQTTDLVSILVAKLNRPVGVSKAYAAGHHCPVFLPPPQLDEPITDYLNSWKGREIWLEAALDGVTYTITEQGSKVNTLHQVPARGMRDETLLCHYAICLTDNQADISLWRNQQDLKEILLLAKNHDVTKAVALWQELESHNI